MSTPHIDYYFSVISPWTYFGHARFLDIAKAAGATVKYHPCNSPELFPATGGKPMKERAKERLDYRMVELKRWKNHLGIHINTTPAHFPVAEAPGSKMILAAQDQGQDAGALLGALLQAVWIDEQNISDPDTLTALANAVGLDGAALLSAAQDPKYDAAFAQSTQNAIASGVFGYPTYITKGEMFWGQDRLDFLERALA